MKLHLYLILVKRCALKKKTIKARTWYFRWYWWVFNTS